MTFAIFNANDGQRKRVIPSTSLPHHLVILPVSEVESQELQLHFVGIV